MTFSLDIDSATGKVYDLGILKLGNSQLHLFGDIDVTQPEYEEMRSQWDESCRATEGVCGIIVAMGVRGKTRGNPELRDALGFFETHYVTPDAIRPQPPVN